MKRELKTKTLFYASFTSTIFGCGFVATFLFLNRVTFLLVWIVLALSLASLVGTGKLASP